MKNFGKQSTFASFLPGIAGIKGIPIWCYYVNRGQGVVSFGVDNKDHSIMEFYPAHMAYQNVKRTGFRTFLKVDGRFFEAFSDEENSTEMNIEMNSLSISESDVNSGIDTAVSYFTIPEERVGALVRKVTLTNTADKQVSIELIDGMPEVIPYGVSLDSMKNMTQTAKAWMQYENAETGVAYYRVRASMNDSATVTAIEGGNFAAAFDVQGNKLEIVADSETVFGYDLSLQKPVIFMEGGIDAVKACEANCSNLLPSAFFAAKINLAAGESYTVYEIIGQVEKMELLNAFMNRKMDGEYFESKNVRAKEIVTELTSDIETKTGDKQFDAYCQYTYMDNLLRGGYPIKLGNNKIFYVYSRKHGDLERDYNYFAMAPEFFSQGNGNFRDVNQNRRCDTFFAPFVGKENIHTFYSLIQLDGYNPLGVEKLTYSLDEKKAEMLLTDVSDDIKAEVLAVVTKAYTPGQLYSALNEKLNGEEADELFTKLIDFSEGLVNGNFGEGYWSDHWTYNLDLVEEYLSVFPEKEECMLYEKAYTYFLSQVNVNPRFKRYEKTAKGMRQYHALDEENKRTTTEKLLRADYGEGEVIYSTLMEKLILLCATKYSTLDAYGMGVEMEGGKPGWYDALNGMPGLFGSSMAETYELSRMLDYTIGALERFPKKVELLEDLAVFVKELSIITDAQKASLENDKQVLGFWNAVNDAKEAYRGKTFEGITGNSVEVDSRELVTILKSLKHTVDLGIAKACEYGGGICPTYFTFDMTEEPLNFEVQMVPFFLEGPVRYLKLDKSIEEKTTLYNNVKASDIYDSKLSMYKVNESLEKGSYEYGRCKAFTPGWLENESVWMHMEYKYLLEVLRSGLYKEFAEDFKKACVPFLDEKVYGRSTLENSSFIASSKNPNKSIHGKGFVARLSGSTIEFISMWKAMMFGKTPFKFDGELSCEFVPVIPEYLVGEDRTVSAKFMSRTMVTYQFDQKTDYFPGQYEIAEMELAYKNDVVANIKGGIITGKAAKDLRDGKIESITVKVCRK